VYERSRCAPSVRASSVRDASACDGSVRGAVAGEP